MKKYTFLHFFIFGTIAFCSADASFEDEDPLFPQPQRTAEFYGKPNAPAPVLTATDKKTIREEKGEQQSLTAAIRSSGSKEKASAPNYDEEQLEEIDEREVEIELERFIETLPDNRAPKARKSPIEQPDNKTLEELVTKAKYNFTIFGYTHGLINQNPYQTFSAYCDIVITYFQMYGMAYRLYLP